MKPLVLFPSRSLMPVLHLILALLLAPVAIRAEALELSVEEAIEQALRSSLDVFGQGQAVATALRNLENRWNLFLPGISAGATARWSDDLLVESPGGAGGAAADPFSTGLSFGTSLSVATGVLFDLEDRRTGYQSAVLSEREARTRLVRDVEKAYFMLVSLELDLANKERAIVLANDRLRLAGYRFDTGLGSELELLRARMSVQTARSTYDKALADYRKRQAAFKRQLGLDASRSLILSTRLEFPSAAPVADLETLVDGRTDLGKTRLAMISATTAINRFVAAYRLPVLRLEASYNISLANHDIQSDRLVFSAGLSFSADSWIPNSRRDIELRSLRESRERLGLKYAQDRRNAIEAVESLVLDLELAGNALLLAEAQLNLAERIHEGTRAAYERGLVTALQLETDCSAVDTARQSLIATRYQYLSLLIDLGYELDTDWRILFR